MYPFSTLHHHFLFLSGMLSKISSSVILLSSTTSKSSMSISRKISSSIVSTFSSVQRKFFFQRHPLFFVGINASQFNNTATQWLKLFLIFPKRIRKITFTPPFKSKIDILISICYSFENEWRTYLCITLMKKN